MNRRRTVTSSNNGANEANVNEKTAHNHPQRNHIESQKNAALEKLIYISCEFIWILFVCIENHNDHNNIFKSKAGMRLMYDIREQQQYLNAHCTAKNRKSHHRTYRMCAKVLTLKVRWHHRELMKTKLSPENANILVGFPLETGENQP